MANSTTKLKRKLSGEINPIVNDLRPYHELVSKINNLHKKISGFDDHTLKTWIKRLHSHTDEDELMIECYAVAKEVCFRCLGIHLHDVQLIGAICLDQHRIIEMQTGEGKTVTAVLASVFNALKDNKVYILTFNDYLAKRDANWMRPVYDFFDIEVSYVDPKMTLKAKKEAYHQPVTYVTAKELGFDFLRCTLAYNNEENILSPFDYCIIDEVDALLIDEARNPLILAGNKTEVNIDRYKVAALIETCKEKDQYEIDERSGNVFLTDKGNDFVQDYSNENVFDAKASDNFLTYVNLALQAKVLLKKNIDYVVQEGKVQLVDPFTGRIVKDRKYNGGLQAAVEAKEKVEIVEDGIILNRTTIQHLIKRFDKISGMTATATSAAEEFYHFYNLPTVVIPPHRTNLRKDMADVYFSTLDQKEKAIVHEIREVHETGQPILVGTLTVSESERLAEKITNEGLQCNILNAKNDEEEAAIIAQAGRKGAITISTNMAGRGTDILLGGGNSEEKAFIESLGGLYVLGTNRHESNRIDRQLRGRSGRQGDPGITRFFISFEDALWEKFKLKSDFKKYYDLPHLRSDDKKLNKIVNRAQRTIENQLYDIRKMLLEYSLLMDLQLNLYWEKRMDLLKDCKDMQPALTDEIRSYLLLRFDTLWAEHLNYMSKVRENIHFVRWAGKTPIIVFRKMADISFTQLSEECEKIKQEIFTKVQAGEKIDVENELKNRPTSTYTYVLNDNPFDDQLSIMLMGNGNLGMQVDFISAFILFIYSLFKKKKT